MSSYIDRLIQEKQELDEKISKLDKFINGPVFGDIDVREQDLQVTQLKHMNEYSRILECRLKIHGIKWHK